MQTDTGNSEPVLQRPFPIVMKHYGWVKNEINILLYAQVMHSSHSSWSAPIIVVPKGIGRKCPVTDYRALNKVTWKFVWPMPKVEDIFAKLNSAKYFSTLNLWGGYHHIPHNEDSIPKELLHLLLDNMSAWRVLLDWHRHQHTSMNSWIKDWRTYPLLLPT